MVVAAQRFPHGPELVEPVPRLFRPPHESVLARAPVIDRQGFQRPVECLQRKTEMRVGGVLVRIGLDSLGEEFDRLVVGVLVAARSHPQMQRVE